MTEHHQYYKSLDGLRAIAVLFVFAFHLDLAGFEGGYLGVDTFFVISGFIVTKVTLKRLNDQQRFDWRDFLLRRAKRLWPESYVSMSATVIGGVFLLKHSEFQRIPISAVAQVGFGSNFRFWLEADDYFDVGAKGKPLLHNWSLAVEEQFYLFFAFILTLWTSKPRASNKPRILLYVLWCVSLGLSLALASSHASSVFYLLPFRAWQFLSGVIPASSSKIHAIAARSNNERAIVELLAFAVFSYFMVGLLFPEQTENISPVLTQLVPVLAVTILLAILVVNEDHETETMIGRFLSVKPLAMIGEISYSIYLWHWPIVCFANSIHRRIDDVAVVSGIVVSTFGLAALSHHFLTVPIRSISNRKIREHFKTSFIAFTLPILSFCALCFLTYKVNFATDSPILRTAHNRSSNTSSAPIIKPTDLLRWKGEGKKCSSYRCVGYALGHCDNDTSISDTVLVIGDSHAATLGAMFTKLQTELHVCVHMFAQSGCGPYLNADIYMPGSRAKVSAACKKQHQFSLETARKYGAKKLLKAIFIIGRWEQHMSYLILDRSGYDFRISLRNKYYASATEFHKKRFQASITASIELLQNLTENLVILYQIPVIPSYSGLPTYCSAENCANFGLKTEDLDPWLSREWIAEVGQKFPDVKFIDPKSIFCDEKLCVPYINGVLAYSDFSHLNNYGAVQLAHLFLPYMK